MQCHIRISILRHEELLLEMLLQSTVSHAELRIADPFKHVEVSLILLNIPVIIPSEPILKVTSVPVE